MQWVQIAMGAEVAATRGEELGSGSTTLIRRERLERIAAAERDRRVGRVEMAIAAIGEAVEWPARAVLALARLAQSEGSRTRQLLEEGLDLWAREIGLDCLDPSEDQESEPASDLASQDMDLVFRPNSIADELDRPVDSSELDLAFEQAEAEVEQMHDVNRVAERVLLDESNSLSEFAGDALTPVEADHAMDSVALRDDLGIDAGFVDPMAAAESTTSQESPSAGGSSDSVLAVLNRWLQNLESRQAGRV